MDLLQLKYFVKIVEHKSFTKAARACDVSQPALSQQIRKLEDELGQQLLERRGRSVMMTTSGHLLLERAEKIMRLVDDTISELTDDGETGRIAISAIPTIGPYLVPNLIETLLPQFPKAQFVIGEEVTDELVNKCSQGEIDLGILATPARAKNLSFEPLYVEQLVVAMRPDHPLASKPALVSTDLNEQPMILLGETHCLSDAIGAYCDQQKIQALSTARIQQLATVKQLVALGQGISFIPEMATRDNLDGRIVFRKLKDRPATRTIALCYNPDRYQSQLLSNFVKAIRELADPQLADLSHGDSNVHPPFKPARSTALK